MLTGLKGDGLGRQVYSIADHSSAGACGVIVNLDREWAGTSRPTDWPARPTDRMGKLMLNGGTAGVWGAKCRLGVTSM